MNIKKLIEENNAAAIAQFCRDNNLVIRDGKIVPRDEDAIAACKEQVGFWDQRQQARKILLNSLYGALLNEALRFSDERMGQSVTLSGRCITRHMNGKINEILAGEYDYAGKAIVYADTDSAYFSAIPVLGDQPITREEVIALYNQVGDLVNASFPEFMDNFFNTGLERGSIIAAGLELVASRGLFIKKKKYACLIYDDEGTRMDVGDSPGKLKVMGLDLKRADTPEYMQNFLKRILLDTLTGGEEEDILMQVRDFRTEFKTKPAWEKGSPKKVSNLMAYGEKKRRASEIQVFTPRGLGEEKKATVPEHVLASLNWNALLDQNDDKHSMRITDGSRIVVCKLKQNNMRMRAVAYPVDEPNLPDWFKALPFNDELMETTIIDKKVANLLEVLEWDLKNTHHNDADDLFTF